MNRMFTKQEIIDLIDQYAPGFDPSKIEEGDILQNAVLGLNEDGEAVKGSLFGKYVRIINPPADANHITEEEYNAFKEGVFINGNFLGFKNPIFLPFVGANPNSRAYGLIIGGSGQTPGICAYFIMDKTRIGKNTSYIGINVYDDKIILSSTYPIKVKGKDVPNYPTSQSGKNYHFTLEDGTLTWHEGNGLYLHTIVFDVGSSNTFTLRFISDSSTACSLDSVTGNFTIAGASFIQLANNGNVVVVPLDENKFAPDIYAFDSASGAFTNNITLASVTSDTVTPIG